MQNTSEESTESIEWPHVSKTSGAEREGDWASKNYFYRVCWFGRHSKGLGFLVR
jgi:hypothetical protein